MQTAEAQPTGSAQRGWMVVIGLAFLGFISLGLPDGLLGVAWPSMAVTLEQPIGALGTIAPFFTAGFLVSSIFSGRLLARLGVGMLLALSCLTTATALLGFAVTPWLGLLLMAVLLGAGGGAIDAGLNAYAAARFSPRVIQWLHACYGIGATAGPALMTALLVAQQPWQVGYILVAMGQILLALCFVLNRRRMEVGDARQAADQHTPSVGLRAALRRPIVWLSILVFVFYTGFEVAVGQWSYTLLTLGRGVAPEVAGQWVALFWASLTIGRILAGLFGQRITPAAQLWGGAIGAAIGAALIGLGSGAVAHIAGLVLAGLSLAPIFPALIATTTARVGRTYAPDTIGLQVAGANIGAAAIPWLIGRSVAATTVNVIGIALVVAAVVYLVLFAWLMLWEAVKR
jgi:fucose permease